MGSNNASLRLQNTVPKYKRVWTSRCTFTTNQRSSKTQWWNGDTEFRQILSENISKLLINDIRIRKETQHNQVLQKMKLCISSKWPKNMSDDLRLFLHRRHSLSTLDGCLMYGGRVVIQKDYANAYWKNFTLVIHESSEWKLLLVVMCIGLRWTMKSRNMVESMPTCS